MRPKAPPNPSNPPANRASDRAAPRGVEDGEEIGGSVKLPEQAGSVGVQPLRGESDDMKGAVPLNAHAGAEALSSLSGNDLRLGSVARS